MLKGIYIKSMKQIAKKAELQLHPNAVKNFNEKANALLLELGPKAPRTSNKSFKPERFISHTITPEKVVGEIRSGLTDDDDNRIAVFFHQDGKLIGLSGEGYKKLASLSEAVQKTETFRRT